MGWQPCRSLEGAEKVVWTKLCHIRQCRATALHALADVDGSPFSAPSRHLSCRLPPGMLSSGLAAATAIACGFADYSAFPFAPRWVSGQELRTGLPSTLGWVEAAQRVLMGLCFLHRRRRGRSVTRPHHLRMLSLVHAWRKMPRLASWLAGNVGVGRLITPSLLRRRARVPRPVSHIARQICAVVRPARLRQPDRRHLPVVTVSTPPMVGKSPSP